MLQKGPPYGFLLIELMVAMAVGLFLFGIGIYWKNSILMGYRETCKRIEAMQQVHNLLDQMQNNPTLVSKLTYDNEDIHMAWCTERPMVEGTHTQFPFINPPKSFKLINLKVSWPGPKAMRSTTVLAGVLLDE